MWFKGIVTIKVSGHYPERFFDLFARHGIPVWSIKKQSELNCIADIYVNDINDIRRLRRQTHYKFSFIRKRGLPFFLKRLKNYQQLLISFAVACLVFLYLTQSILFINIEGVTIEAEEQIRASLDNYGIKRGKLKFFMDKPDQVQARLLTDHPEFLWVGINPDGVTYRREKIEPKTYKLTIADWTLPLSFLSNTHKEVELFNQERSEDETVTIALDQARQNLLRNLDPASSIIKEKILHQTIENGKVNLHVYFTVNENIVNTVETSQGD